MGRAASKRNAHKHSLTYLFIVPLNQVNRFKQGVAPMVKPSAPTCFHYFSGFNCWCFIVTAAAKCTIFDLWVWYRQRDGHTQCCLMPSYGKRTQNNCIDHDDVYDVRLLSASDFSTGWCIKSGKYILYLRYLLTCGFICKGP